MAAKINHKKQMPVEEYRLPDEAFSRTDVRRRRTISNGVKLLDLGLIDYLDALNKQKELLCRIKSGNDTDTLILCEHNHVFTLGRRAKEENILCGIEGARKIGVDVIPVDRGGDVTYHGKGQLVAYMIFDLRKDKKDLSLFLRRLERVVLGVLNDYGIRGSLIEGRRGVWVNKKKIASIGIGVSGWVTYHGLSFNINTDLKFFSMINPCGYRDVEMVSLSEILNAYVDLVAVKAAFINNLAKVFERNVKTGGIYVKNDLFT
ncbi:MAG TPA: lipoyl(octanoyl) transferase LipB [Candidatus Omnitrophica bacterium]|nr:lipoyl(octanoyl) transferase LipB [Candidatus Omnitrophota bacterium]